MSRSRVGNSPLRFISAGLALGAVLLAPASAEAHLRWFVDSTEAFRGSRYTLDGMSLAIIAGAALYIALSWWVHRRPVPDVLARLGSRSRHLEWRVIAALLAGMLIVNLSRGTFVAPNLTLPGHAIPGLGATLQAVLAVLLLVQVSLVIPGLLLLLCLLLAALYFPALLSLDYIFEFLFLSASFVLVGPQLSRVDRWLYRRAEVDPERYSSLPLPLVRVGFGLTLAILALHNKLSSPELVLTFLSEHEFNFVQALGVAGFTDVHFALAAGLAELTFGVLLVLGVATRFVTLSMICFFTMTLFVLGPIELAGHLPIFGFTTLLALRGAGSVQLAARTLLEGHEEVETLSARQP